MNESRVHGRTVLDSFAEQFRGRLVRPGEADYDDVRAIWNGMIDRKPALIARCACVGDIVSSIRFARANGLPASVRGGGHNAAGRAVCDGGLMIDLSLMRKVEVDPAARIARVQGGAILKDLDTATLAHGLATTAGTDSRTGVAGLTLGGGLGYLARKHGLALDNLVGVELVTADGEVLHASENENADLFWAVRGGGGNFGVVSTFEFCLHPLGPEIMTAQAFYRQRDGREALRFYRDFMASAPDEVNLLAAVAKIPPAEPFPEEHHGQPAVVLVGAFAGDMEQGRSAFAPLESVGDPILKAIGPMPYTTLQTVFEAGAPDGIRYYGKSQFLSGLPDDAVNAVVARTKTIPGAYSLVFFETMGGAVNRVAPSATAFPNRNAAFNFSVLAGWEDTAEDGEIKAWVREFHDAMKPYSTGGVYSNYLSEDEDDRTKDAYGANLERLREIKARYDPDNFFRLNQNIPPKG